LITEIRIPVLPAPGITVHVSAPFGDAVRNTREALAHSGFDVVTETDVQYMLRNRLGEHIDDYLILGACNPRLAGQALAIDPQAGLMLPCSVVVRSVDTGTLVQAADPVVFVQIGGTPALQDIAEQVRRLLVAALDTLRPAATGMSIHLG
jgi:uncharacterized protein (DUF302 family)